MISVAAIVAVAFAGVGMVAAAPNPTEPSSTSVFNAGTPCSIKWDMDTTGAWKDMNIELMTGDNWNMVHITTVAQNIDATTTDSYSYDCPEVNPYSAIYFYQFSHKEDPKDLLWTTRFAIADADGKTTTPTETTQPDGQKIAWGTGALVDPSQAVAAPSYLGGSQSGTSATGSSAVASASSSATGSVVATVTTTPAGSASASASQSMVTTVTMITRVSSRTTSGTSSAASSTASASANAAMGNVAPGVMAVVGAVLAAAGLF